VLPLVARCAGSVVLGRRAEVRRPSRWAKGGCVRNGHGLRFRGPANQSGLACLHTSSTAKSAYSFRLDETRLRVFRRVNGSTKELAPGRSRRRRLRRLAGSGLELHVRRPSLGRESVQRSGYRSRCSVYTFKGIVQVACFKQNAKGALNRSYAVALAGRQWRSRTSKRAGDNRLRRQAPEPVALSGCGAMRFAQAPTIRVLPSVITPTCTSRRAPLADTCETSPGRPGARRGCCSGRGCSRGRQRRACHRVARWSPPHVLIASLDLRMPPSIPRPVRIVEIFRRRV